ncbi:hypothetical protein [Streptomyces misionensis]
MRRPVTGEVHVHHGRMYVESDPEAGESAWDLGLARTDYRVRCCARGMDKGSGPDTRGDKEPRAVSCLLPFWPGPPRPEQVIRQTSRIAACRHRFARGLPSPAAPEERAERERLAREAEERAAEERAAEERRLHHERWEWGGRLPSGRLRAVGGNVRGLLRFDSDLVHALDAAGPGVQRTTAVLAAHRACEAAGLTDVPWVARALTALSSGRPLPPPFDDPALMRETLRRDPRVPDRSVLGAVPPERPPYRPPVRGEYDTPVFMHGTTGPSGRGPISQPHFALPAVLAAADPAPLRAALDAVWHAVHTYGEHYPRLLAEVRSGCAGPPPADG